MRPSDSADKLIEAAHQSEQLAKSYLLAVFLLKRMSAIGYRSPLPNRLALEILAELGETDADPVIVEVSPKKKDKS